MRDLRRDLCAGRGAHRRVAAQASARANRAEVGVFFGPDRFRVAPLARLIERKAPADACLRTLALAAAEIVEFADFDAVVTQDVVRGRHVEEEVGQHEREQIAQARELDRARTHLERDGLVFAAVDLFGLERVQVVDGLLDACVQFVERHFHVVELRRFHARETGGAALGRVGGDMNLAQQRQHVGEQSRAGEHRGVDLLFRRVRLCLADDRLQVGEAAREHGHRSLIQGDGHGDSSFLRVMALLDVARLRCFEDAA
ncbi:hypothetical protein PT2222_430016 [Paraburkholderia tropica]